MILIESEKLKKLEILEIIINKEELTELIARIKFLYENPNSIYEEMYGSNINDAELWSDVSLIIYFLNKKNLKELPLKYKNLIKSYEID